MEAALEAVHLQGVFGNPRKHLESQLHGKSDEDLGRNLVIPSHLSAIPSRPAYEAQYPLCTGSMAQARVRQRQRGPEARATIRGHRKRRCSSGVQGALEQRPRILLSLEL